MEGLNLLDKLDELAAIYSVPWGLRNAFKGDVLALLKEAVESEKEKDANV